MTDSEDKKPGEDEASPPAEAAPVVDQDQDQDQDQDAKPVPLAEVIAAAEAEAASASVDDEWGAPAGAEAAPSPPVEPDWDQAAPPVAAPPPAHRRPPTPEPEPEPEPEPDYDDRTDYAAEAEAWRRDLDSAVGVESKPDRREGKKKKSRDKRPRNPRRTLIAVGLGALAVLIAVVIVLGYLNSRHYYFVCGAEYITGERGRKFPPWGQHRLSGKEWNPIKIPPDAECVPSEYDDIDALENVFTNALVEQAEALLTSGEPDNVEIADKQLLQALLLTRTPERRDLRKKIERLRGDVEYWRAAAQIETIVARLTSVSDQFDQAAARRPRLNSNASAWARFARKISDELRRGPPALRKDVPLAPDSRPPFVPPDSEPTQPSEPVDAGVPAELPPDAQPGVALPPSADAAPPPPDAGLPRGGVLL